MLQIPFEISVCINICSELPSPRALLPRARGYALSSIADAGPPGAGFRATPKLQVAKHAYVYIRLWEPL